MQSKLIEAKVMPSYPGGRTKTIAEMSLSELRARSAEKSAEFDGRPDSPAGSSQVAAVTDLRLRYDIKFDDMIRTIGRLEAENKELYLMMKSQTQALDLL